MLRKMSMLPLLSRSVLTRVSLLTALCVASVAFAFDFLGPESCQSCHPDAYAAWKASPHARAKEALSVQQQKDVRCVTCHSPNEAEQKVASVSCETCHGGAQFYTPRYVMKDAELARLAGLVDPGEKSCVTCHDSGSPSLKPFNFAEKLKAIDHWSAARANRGAK